MGASDPRAGREAALRVLARGTAIPAHPLAIDRRRKLDERRQRALSRYYIAAGAGGLAVGVHTTQFAIRRPEHGLLRPVLELAAEEARRACPDGAGGPAGDRAESVVLIAGVCGPTPQAVAEAELARSLGYHAALLSLGALRDAGEDALIDHCRAVAEVLPLVGFYLQPAVGGRVLPCTFWRRFAGIPEVAAIKIAPFDRYRTLDVVRAVAESGRDDIALYTGNDDSIVLDLLTPFRFRVGGKTVERRIVGGLLGHWAVWTRRAVELLDRCRRAAEGREPVGPDLLATAAQVTDANAAVFDAANGFRGCIAGIHEVLRRAGLLEGNWCLDPAETLGPGQLEEIDRAAAAYPHLRDDDFVAANIDRWLSG
jgi:dihydrodipicolinate synthase/N-acetylneuraminate lyase